MKLNKEKAEDAIRTKIAEPLGMTVVEAAAGFALFQTIEWLTY